MRTDNVSNLRIWAFTALLTMSSRELRAQITIPAPGFINTVAGDGVQGTSGNGGSALNAELDLISGLAFDGSGDMFILDQCVVREVSAATGKITIVAGTGTCGYSGDTQQATSAEIGTYFSSKIDQKSVGGIATDFYGNLYIADGLNNRVREVNMTTGIITTIAGTGASGYSGDKGAATKAELYSPETVAVDSQGNVYITDTNNNRIREILAATGTIITIAGTGTEGYSGDGGAATSAKIAEPYGIAVDIKGNVYFIDTYNHRIRSISAQTGTINTIAGNGTWGYSGDGGLATSAELNQPSAIAVDSFGNIYIDDTYNYRIRYINASSKKIATVAGDGTLGATGDGGLATSAEAYGYGGIAVNTQSAFVFADSAAFRVRAVGGAGVTGVINPKYAIVGVTYAPPGPSSYVEYTDSTYVGNTSSISSSYSNSESISISIFAGLKAWGGNGFTGTASNTATQMSNSTSTVTVSVQSSDYDLTPGTPNAFSPVDHNYDIIWLWLNPLVAMTLNPNNPSNLLWNGYAYDTADGDVIDVYGVYVGQLNGTWPFDGSAQQELTRAWAIDQTWPTGEGPALTNTDYAAILAADPFSNSSYTVTINLNSSPSTTTDGRFSLSNNNQALDYEQAPPPNGTPITEGLTDVYTNTNTTAQTSQYTFQEAFGMEQKYGGTFFGLGVTADLQKSQTLTWTNQTTTSITYMKTVTDQGQVTGPPCSGTIICSPAYSGPGEFQVFQDNVYGTFMFNPKPN